MLSGRYEVLRLYNNASIARKGTVSTVISNKKIHKNETIIGLCRQIHLNVDIFGPNITAFDPNRFVANKRLNHVRGYYPFGGGNLYCPGRFFARSKIYIFVATVLKRFDMEILESQELPNVDLEVPSSSAMPAMSDCLVKLRPRILKE
jgi:cytochrome P450